MASESDSIFGASVKLSIAKGLNAILVFAGTALFARVIGADQLGTYFLFEKLLGLVVVFSNFGLAGALEKRLSEGEDREEYMTTVAIMKIAIVVVLASIIFLSRYHINTYLEADLAVLLILAIVLRESGRLFFNALRGVRRVGETSYLLAAKQMAWVGIGGALATTGLGYLAPVYGFLVGLGAVLVLGYLMADVQFGRPSITHAKSLLQFSKWDFISSSIGWQIYNTLDTLLIGFFLTTVAVSQYEVAWRISTIVMTVTASISAVIFPSFSKFVMDGEHSRIQKTVTWALGAGFLFSIPALSGVIVLGEPMLRYLFGAEYTSAAIVLVLLVADKSSRHLRAVCGQVVRAYDRPDLSAAIAVSTILLNGVSNYLLIPRIGILGAGIATVGSLAVETILFWFVARKFVLVKIPWQILGWQCFSAVIMGITLYQLTVMFPISSMLDLALFIVLGIAIYGIIIVFHSGTRTLIQDPLPET